MKKHYLVYAVLVLVITAMWLTIQQMNRDNEHNLQVYVGDIPTNGQTYKDYYMNDGDTGYVVTAKLINVKDAAKEFSN